MNPVVIAEIKKNAVEKIVFTISKFRNKRILDMRIYYEDNSGQWKPTRKGLALTEERIEPFLEALNKGIKALKGESDGK